MATKLLRILLKRAIGNKPGVVTSLLRLSALIHTGSYDVFSRLAILAEHGVHPKHRVMQYHSFFMDNVAQGDSVLDVGCNTGEVLKAVVAKTGARATGIDISDEYVAKAKEQLGDYNSVNVVTADVWEFETDERFDIIMLSNVLEHLDDREKLLTLLVRKFKPRKLLLRVPMFERSWVVPYLRELGVEWRLDPTHMIEYTEEQLMSELTGAHLVVEKLYVRWGEFYVVARPA